MGRIIKELELEGRKVKALFDTGSERSYIKDDVLPKPRTCIKVEPFKTGLGGETREVKETCVINPNIEGMGFDFSAHPLDEIGEIDGEEIDLLVGALAMEKWEIKLDPNRRELDLTGLKKREFTEF